MANTYKNIVITPNRDTDAANVPSIRFSGGDTTSNTDINVRVYTAQNGTLSFEGSAGQLFSVTNDLTGTIFSVNDVSGIPSVEIDAAGLVKLTEFGGNVAVGRANATYKVDVVGGVNASAFFINGQPTNIQGIQGLQGRQGTQGFQGIQGATGSQGFQGIQGTLGLQGFQGIQGTTGSQGIQGIQGTLGLQGFQGIQGTLGLQGFQGIQGATGSQGFQGIQGTLGLQGFQGIQGTTGSQGIQGLRGASDWTPNFSGGVTQSSSDSSTFTKTSGTNGAWDGQVYSTQGYVRGVYATARASQTNGYIMFGLNSDPSTDGNYTSMDYSFYFDGISTIQIYENGSAITSYGAYTTSTVLTITYDGVNVRYYNGATLLRTVARAIGNPLYFDSSFYNTGTSLNSVGFGPMGESVQGIQGTLGLQGFQGIQGTTGTQGANGTQGSTGTQGANGFQGTTGTQGANGFQGLQGTTGSTGDKGGVRYTFSTTTTDADPGNGIIRYNNATIASVTTIFIDNLDAAGITQTDWYDTWDDSTTTANRGYITVVGNLAGSTVVNIFQVTGQVIPHVSGYYKIPVSYVSGTLPADATALTLGFSRTGNQGATGVQGANGFQGTTGTSVQGTAGTVGVTTFSAGSTGLTPSTATAGAVSLAGTLAIASGGTGASDAANARTNLGLAIGTNVQAYDADLAAIAALAPTADNFIVGNGTTWTLETPSAARTSLGLVIGTNVQAYSARLADIAGLSPTSDNFIVGDGSNFVIETPSQARTSLGLVIGTNVQAYSARLADIAGLSPTSDNFIVGDGSNWIRETPSQARSSLGLGTIATQDSSSVSITGGTITGITNLRVATSSNLLIGRTTSTVGLNTRLDVNGAVNASAFLVNGVALSGGGGGGVTSFSAGSTGFSPSSATTGAIVLSGTLDVTNGGTGSTSESGARNNLGLGSIATQDSSSVSITGGTITGITNLRVATSSNLLIGRTTSTVGLNTRLDVNGAVNASAFLVNGVALSGGGGGGVTSFSAGSTGFSPSSATTGAIVLSGTLDVTNGGTGGTSQSTARSGLGLGSIATQSSSSVSISGGSITGITDLAVADGGTGASNKSGARTNLGISVGTTAPGSPATGDLWVDTN